MESIALSVDQQEERSDEDEHHESSLHGGDYRMYYVVGQ